MNLPYPDVPRPPHDDESWLTSCADCGLIVWTWTHGPARCTTCTRASVVEMWATEFAPQPTERKIA